MAAVLPRSPALPAGAASTADAASEGASLQRYLRALWAIAPTLCFDAERPHIVGSCLHLPPTVGGLEAAAPATTPAAGWSALCAAAAHAVAHLVYSPPVFDGRGLRPMVRALVGVLEDARVEALACRELPGLRRLWAPWHTVQPGEGADAQTLLLRLARVLADPAHADPHPWVQKGRRLFYLDPGTGDATMPAEPVLALHQHAALRHAASLLGNDLGQMRLPLNARLYRPGPAYRDDNRWMWPHDSEALTEPVMSPPPPPPSRPTSDARSDARSADVPDKVRPESSTSPARRHPEWDRLIERLRPQWCAVHEHRVVPAPALDATGSGGVQALGLAASMGPGAQVAHPLRQPVRQALRQVDAPPARRGQLAADGEAFDLDALLRARIAQRLQVAVDPRVHRRARPGRHRGAVLVLIDRSASSVDAWDGAQADASPALSPGAPPVSLLQAACESAALAVDALQSLGLTTALCGFHSDGRHRVQFDEVLGFGEPLDDAALRRLAALRSRGSTRLGAVLRHAVHRLRAQDPAARARGGSPVADPDAPRWVLLISDGQPHDIDVHDPRYLVADARMAVRQAAQQRVAIGCLALVARRSTAGDRASALDPTESMGNDRPPGSARQIFGQRQVAVLDRMDVLPQRLRRLLEAALR